MRLLCSLRGPVLYTAVAAAPGPDKLIARARDLVPALARRARECEERRAVPPETIADFRDAGFLRLLRPSRFGGHQVGLTTLADIVGEVARGCGSSAWCLALFATHNRLAALFPDGAQHEVFADTDGTAVAAVYAPTGIATPDGEASGFRLTGRWRFASGCDHARWVALAARVAHEREGPIADVRCFLVPAAEVRIDDTWFVAGLKGTGSKDVVAEDVRVPPHRVVTFVDIARGATPGAALDPSPLYRLPVLPLLSLVCGGVALGLARAAIESFRARESAGARSTTVTSSTGAMPLAEALASVDAAELLLRRALDDLDRRGAAEARLSAAQRARHLLDGAFVVTACTRAVGALLTAGGADALFDARGLARAFRDLQAMSAHAALQFPAAAERFGRMELGLPADSRLLLI